MLLGHADAHLAAMAIPYVLSLHEHYVKDCCGQQLVADQLMSSRHRRDLKMETMHREVELSLRKRGNFTFTPASVELFHYLRLFRNALIHNNGRVSAQLVAFATGLSPAASTAWSKVAHSPTPAFVVGQPLPLDVPHMIGCLGITIRLARELNLGMATNLSVARWLAVLNSDFNANTTAVGNANQRRRALQGYARYHGYLIVPGLAAAI